MTLTSWSLGPSQCSSCLKTSRPLLMALTLAVLAGSCSSRFGLQEGDIEDGEAEASPDGSTWVAPGSSFSSSSSSRTGTKSTRC